ncbi:gliding motility lipoprotein GldB [Flavobacterium sp. CBA20B-1]|uniref:gliding motility lipoprotein GldB n=1 Tax=unclassified Flavobacterium TaxID=196869 RepID=UPI002224A73F|nr:MULTISPECIES: gliding motility lipoprotein GldB [unclassified Flavobacterium]WCM43406.1 gliding motility lipoprotein GldB [Flavobacterium sp. CBA20B-1]
MKNTFYLLFCSLFFVACEKENTVRDEILAIPVEAKIERFDQEFMQTTPESFDRLKQKYPYLLTASTPDSVWFKKKNDSLFGELYKETQDKFKDVSELQKELSLLFKHIKYYFPNENPGKVVTVLSEVDIMSRAIYADSIAVISLDTYLGKDHKFYVDFDSYTLGDFEPNRIVVDLAEHFAAQKIAAPQERTFISQMIYWGKIMYFKEQLLPEVNDALKMNYTPEQMQWIQANEAQVWKYFVESKYLYDNDVKLIARFIQRAPFSKFYLELDQESPGSVGVYIGWQIVRSYMKNNNVTLQELALKDAKTIFDESKYKPKK